MPVARGSPAAIYEFTRMYEYIHTQIIYIYIYICVYAYLSTLRTYVCICETVQTEQSHVKLVAIGVLQTRGACHLGADHGDTHGRGRRRGQQARLHPCKWCTARTVLPENLFVVLSTESHTRTRTRIYTHLYVLFTGSHAILHEFTPRQSPRLII